MDRRLPPAAKEVRGFRGARDSSCASNGQSRQGHYFKTDAGLDLHPGDLAHISTANRGEPAAAARTMG